MTMEKKSQLMFPFSKDRVLYIRHDIDGVLVQNNIDIEQCAGLLKANPAIVVVNDRRELIGTITNGDIRRLVERKVFHKGVRVTAGDACNKSPVYAHINDPVETLTHHFSARVSMLPLVDSNKTVCAYAYVTAPYFKIGTTVVTDRSCGSYTIAEIGVNHNGSVQTAKDLVTSARDAGFSAVKFQVRSKEYFTTSDFNALDLGAQYLKQEIERTFLEHSEIEELIGFAKSQGVDVVCTPFDASSLKFCLENDVDAIKIASCDLTNLPLLQAAAAAGLPLIVSTGMSWEREILSAYRVIISHTANFAFLHCNSTYPCPAHDVNLRYLERLRDLMPCVVGYSSHDADPLVSALAVAKGARIIEAHITHAKNQKGTDHKASLAVEELDGFIRKLKSASIYLGNAFPRTPSQGEMLNRLSLGKSLCVARDIAAGTALKEADLELRSPGNGFGYDQLDQVVGKILQTDRKKGELLGKSDVGLKDERVSFQKLEEAIAKLEQKGLVTGIPVRYHDVLSMRQEIPARFFEFHMSGSDLALDPRTIIPESLPWRQLFVHAVEQYPDGFILDFASADGDIVEESKTRFRQFIDHVDKLITRYPALEQCSIIVNIGGFGRKSVVDPVELRQLHSRAVETLLDVNKLLDGRNIELLPQTMPPMPWHQGGVAYHNLLVTPNSINEIARRTDLKVCLDISHSYLAANELGMDMSVFAREIAGVVSYLHVSDASRLSQEGLQISEGDIDLAELLTMILKKKSPVLYVPEIWNGHSNSGEGFKLAILRLAELLEND